MIAAAFLVGVAVGIAFLAICNAWDHDADASSLDSPPADLTADERLYGSLPWGERP